MKIVIAPDSFKESLTAADVAQAISEGFAAVYPDADLVRLPVADGGEGTTAALTAATGGVIHKQAVTGPLGYPVEAFWGMLGDNRTAVIETAAASGLDLVSRDKRNPLVTTTYGTGELIRLALDRGAEKIILGLGGSATNDGGAGLLQALGARFLDQHGQPIPPGGGGLAKLATIDLCKLDPRLSKLELSVACDVDNPLLGENGASAIFGPQKGATPEMVQQLDLNLAHFAEQLLRTTGIDVTKTPGSGAAGGIAAVLLPFFNASLRPGIDIVLDAIGIEEHLSNADLVITGEGRLDSQSIAGKTPVGVARRAKKFNLPVVAIAGSLATDAELVTEHGIDALFSCVPGAISLDQAMQEAFINLRNTSQNIARISQLLD